jgi:Lecithin:cholesterol acyltransferase
MVHGRGQASDAHTESDQKLLDAWIARIERTFRAGLAKGLVLSGLEPIRESDVVFPFYGNALADAIKKFESSGGKAPPLKVAAERDQTSTRQSPQQLEAEMLDEMAGRLGYTPGVQRADVSGMPQYAEFKGFGDLDDVLRIPLMTEFLQFLSRKTGLPAEIIRAELTDVAYYLGDQKMRDLVLDIVRDKVKTTTSPGDNLVVIGHSLGSVVAYDFLARNDSVVSDRTIKLFVTAGCPLGLKPVKSNLLGVGNKQRPSAPKLVPSSVAAWINAYDPLDVVALVHPLGPEFRQSPRGQIADIQTRNPSGPHNIIDYLADPDVAAPIGRAFTSPKPLKGPDDF